LLSRHEVDLLLADWERRSLLAVLAHARSANRCATWNVRLGGLATALTAVVGTSIFATLQEDLSITARVIVGVVTIAAAISTAVTTFAALPARKEAYEQASRRHASVRRSIETVRTRLAAGKQFDVWAEIAELQVALDEAARGMPNASARIWDRTRRQLKGEFTWWEKLWCWARGLPPPRAIGVPEDVGGPLPVLDAED
jgi:hypothetical protein